MEKGDTKKTQKFINNIKKRYQEKKILQGLKFPTISKNKNLAIFTLNPIKTPVSI